MTAGRRAAAPRVPAKRWRVYGARGISEDYRSQRAAYEAVKTINALGNTARVYHWEGGSWRRYEHVEPVKDYSSPAEPAGTDDECE